MNFHLGVKCKNDSLAPLPPINEVKVGLLSFMVEHLQTVRGALVSVLFLKGVGLAEKLTEQKKLTIFQAPWAQGGGYITYHTMAFHKIVK